jgi:hypothetical protein
MARVRVRQVMLVAVMAALIAALLAPTARAAKDLTIAPEDPTGVSNCWPFGQGGPGEDWTPYFAFFYKNIPKFKLKKGDRLAFDLGAPNIEDPSSDIQVEIAMAPTTTNGGTTQARPFKRVVRNTQTPRNPRGDSVVGNFELSFKATPKKTFKFPGGGLVIRFSNPSAGYRADETCDQVLVGTTESDPSGYFVGRTDPSDPDGVAPWEGVGTSDVGGFRIQKAPQTRIRGGPKGDTTDRDAEFRLKSSDRRSKFKCRLDGKKLRPCKKKLKLDNLDAGKHVLKVKAKDKDGLTDATPAKRKWTVLP